jgi:O-antigen/teichoic acid export membrane protein
MTEKEKKEGLSNFVGNVISLTTSQYVSVGLNFLLNIILARTLGAYEYGTLSIMMAYPLLILGLFSFKPGSIATRYIPGFYVKRQSEKIKSIVKSGYILDLSTFIFAFLFVSATAWWVSKYFFHKAQLALLMIIYASSFIMASSCGISQSILSSFGHFRTLSLLLALEPFIILSSVAVLIFLKMTKLFEIVIVITLGRFFAHTFQFIAANIILRKLGLWFWWKGSFKKISPVKNELMSLLGWNYLITSLGNLTTQIPIMLLGHIRGPEEAGFCKLAFSFLTTFSFTASSMFRVAYPSLSAEMVTKGIMAIKGRVRRWTIKVGIPAGIAISLGIPALSLIIPTAFGKTYEAMITGTQIMVLSSVVWTLFFWTIPVCYALGMIKLWTKLYALYSIFVIGAGYICATIWGFNGFSVIIAVGRCGLTLGLAYLLNSYISTETLRTTYHENTPWAQ